MGVHEAVEANFESMIRVLDDVVEACGREELGDEALKLEVIVVFEGGIVECCE